ncbi:MAG: hypothetical protein ACK5ZV_05075 [bacterium]
MAETRTPPARPAAGTRADAAARGTTALLDPHLLLCESCGYDLTTLPQSGSCPECGADRAASSPALRVGSPWQVRGASPLAWLVEVAHLGPHPGRWRAAFGRVRVDWPASRSLLVASVVLASVVAGVGFALAGMWLTAGIAAIVGPLLLHTLTAIETVGLRMFGRQRSWRITSDVAWVVVAHASPAWVLAGVLTPVGSLVGARVLPWVEVFIWPVPGVVSGGVIGFLAGMFVFETVVFFGVRRCHFANLPSAGSVVTPGSGTTAHG